MTRGYYVMAQNKRFYAFFAKKLKNAIWSSTGFGTEEFMIDCGGFYCKAHSQKCACEGHLGGSVG